MLNSGTIPSPELKSTLALGSNPKIGELTKSAAFHPQENGWPKVSIVISARNNGRYLAEAIKSALQQGVVSDVIYSDDCSSDDSLEVARRFEEDGLVVLSCPYHRGVCETRNRGAVVAKGQYLVFLDGDDCLSPDFVEQHLKQVEPATPFVYGPAHAFGSGPNAGTFWDVPAWEEYDVWARNTVNTSAMYARWAFEGAGRWRDSVRSMWDWDLALRACRFGTPKPSRAVLYYRMHPTSWSSETGEHGEKQKVEQCLLVRRANAKLSIGSILSGRIPELFPRWIAAVAQAVRFLKLSVKPELVALDNSGDLRARAMFLAEANRYCDTFEAIRILPYPVRFKANTELDRRDGMAQFLADASNRLRSEMLGDIHWIVEDDILVPYTAGDQLWLAITAGASPPHAVAGCYRNRHTPDMYVGGWWKNGKPEEIRKLPPGDDPLSVDFTGTGCLMYWRDRTPKLWKSHFEGIPAHDWNWGMQLKAMGGSLSLLPQVRCGHAIDARQIIEG